MKPGLRNFLAIVGGLILGSAVNMLVISRGGELVSPPQGVNPEDIKSIKANIHLYETKHYIIPFLAHAIGTLVASFAAVKWAIRRKKTVGIIVGTWFLFGGIAAASMIGAPFVPTLVDVAFAYYPLAWLGFVFAK
ncbi:MAG: hypothetical protein P8N47_02345 [Bacteroidia bacterium]|jgi:hypothetical protein|nr:hypothetical protein [Bacteroidia bacterium]